MARDVHVHDSRRLADQMIVDRRNFHSAFLQLPHDRLNLVFREYEIAHYHCEVAGALECRPRSQSQTGFDCHIPHHHMQILPRHSKPDYISRLRLPRPSHCLFYGPPISARRLSVS